MSQLNSRQKAILRYLETNDQTTVRKLVEHLTNDFSITRRTIIRDLDYLLELGYISRLGAGRGTYYRVSDRLQIVKKIDIDSYFKKTSEQRTVHNRRFNFDIFDSLTEPVFFKEERELLIKLDKKFRKNFSKYDSQTIINKEYERILIEFSWKSSQIEGNTYSLLGTEVLIKENRADETKSKKETQMILNHKDAFNEVLMNRDLFQEISRGNIEYIHQLLTKKLGVKKNIRNLPVGITGTNYIPLDNSYQLQDAIDRMAKLLNTKDDVFEKAFLSLLLLSYIQAFEDGNKRTARMVSNAILLAHNSIPMSYRAVNEVEYKKATILFYEQNNISYFKEIFIKQFEFAVHNYFM